MDMKSSLRFLAAFGVAAALLGGGCMPGPQPEPTAITQPIGSTVLDFKSVTTKNGKTDSLRNLTISGTKGSVANPVKVTGEARLWYFEASFPVELYDAESRLIGSGPAQAKADWMTEDWVPFEAQFAFPDQPNGARGKLVLRKDNPSGLPEHDDSVEIPVTF